MPTTALTHKSPIARFYPNRASWQIKGLLYWVSPQVDGYPSTVDPFGYKKLDLVNTPDIWTDGEMGLAYRVGDVYVAGVDAQTYASKRVSIDYITCTAWIKGGNQASDANVIRGDDTGGSRNFQFRVASSVLRWIPFYRAGGNGDLTGTTAVNDNKWHHIAATYNGVDNRIYVDGKLDKAPLAQAGLLNNALGDYYFFGSYSDYYYIGLMGDARIYNRALSAAEIYALYNPATRWDLYKPVTPYLEVLPFAPAIPHGAFGTLRKKRFHPLLIR